MENRILLVDDNKMILEIEKDFLQYAAAEIFTAYDGVEALDIARTKRLNLIFLDLEMPRMDGASCCRVFKAEPDLAAIHVVMVTALKSEADRDNCFSAGCDEILAKPLDRDIFLDVARRFLPNLNRRQPRVSAEMQAFIKVGREVMPCTLVNLSVGGAYLATDYVGTPHEVVGISFILPTGVAVECHGWIVRLQNKCSLVPRGMGVKFAMMPAGAQEAVQEFIVRRHEQGNPVGSSRNG